LFNGVKRKSQRSTWTSLRLGGVAAEHPAQLRAGPDCTPHPHPLGVVHNRSTPSAAPERPQAPRVRARPSPPHPRRGTRAATPARRRHARPAAACRARERSRGSRARAPRCWTRTPPAPTTAVRSAGLSDGLPRASATRSATSREGEAIRASSSGAPPAAAIAACAAGCAARFCSAPSARRAPRLR
jgi:hypothetical protein